MCLSMKTVKASASLNGQLMVSSIEDCSLPL